MVSHQEWLDTDYYEVLGVPETATQKEIARAYRTLAKQYHPDANLSCDEQFKEISAAYEVLGNQTRRTEYDKDRLSVIRARTAAERGRSDSSFDAVEDVWADALSDRWGGTRREAAPGFHGQGLVFEAHLSLGDLLRGVTKGLGAVGRAADAVLGDSPSTSRKRPHSADQ